jgi:hypothetical protein
MLHQYKIVAIWVTAVVFCPNNLAVTFFFCSENLADIVVLC